MNKDIRKITDIELQDWNNAIEAAVEAYAEFESKYMILWGNILDIVKEYKLDRPGIKIFLKTIGLKGKKLNNGSLERYLLKAIQNKRR